MRFVTTVVLAAAVVLLAGVLAQPALADLSFDVAYSNLNQHGSWLVGTVRTRLAAPRVQP